MITTNTSVGEIYLCHVTPVDVRNLSAASLLVNSRVRSPYVVITFGILKKLQFPFSRMKLFAQPCTAQLVGIISQTKEYNRETIEVRCTRFAIE